MTVAYNRQGELRFSTDQAATKHQYLLDKLGRPTVDKATAFGSNIDSTINAIRAKYDDLGRLEKVTSNSGYDDEEDQGDIENAVEFAYTTLWQIDKVWQQHDDDTETSGGSESLKTSYSYALSNSATKNFSRMTTLTYPNGYQLPYIYSSGTDDLISRVSGLNVHGGSGSDVTYSFIGVDMVAMIDMAGPSSTLDVQLDRYQKYDGSTPSPGIYPGFDRFGRIARQMWVDQKFYSVSNHPVLVDLVSTYNKASNKLAMDNKNDIISGWMIRDSKFTHDELMRLMMHDKGQSGSPFVYAPPTSRASMPVRPGASTPWATGAS